jgi:hypothetical protein
MSALSRPNHLHLTLLLWLLTPALQALAANRPGLSNPAWTAGQFQFLLNGETNTTYILESSADLHTWSAALTNSEPQAARMIGVLAPDSARFWRATRITALSFSNAIAARGLVSFTNIMVDSFDSADPNFSTLGGYDPLKRKAGGDVTTGSWTPGMMNLGNSQVAGVVYTGPGGNIIYGPNGAVGDLAWLSNPANAGMIQPGHYRDDAILRLADSGLPAPFAPVLVPGPGTVGGTNYDYVLGDGYYRVLATLSLTGKMIVTGDAALHVTGTLRVVGSAEIVVGSGARLRLYVGTEMSVSGGGIVNPGDAASVQCYGLPTCVIVSYHASVPFTGIIYAPTADVLITSEVVGAIVGKTVRTAGNVHFDENLKRAGPFF